MSPMTAREWLEAFWLSVSRIPDRHVDYVGVHAARLNALQQLAVVALSSPTFEQLGELRREQPTATADREFERECFVCGGEPRERIWHHVILLSHGGTNSKLNMVLLCAGCHAQVHPWLQYEPSAVEGFVQVGQLAGSIPRTMARAQYRESRKQSDR